MKPLIVGEAPSKNQSPEQPIEGRIGLRLAVCAGMTLPEFLTFFERVNLLHVRQDTAAHGFQFDEQAAALEAEKFRATFTSERIIILLGQRVAKAFGITPTDCYFVQHSIGAADVRVLPHPSGINRWWNSKENLDHATLFMQNIVRRVRG